MEYNNVLQIQTYEQILNLTELQSMGIKYKG